MTLEIRLRACIEGKYAQFFLDRDEQIRVLTALSQPQPVAQGEAVGRVCASDVLCNRYVDCYKKAHMDTPVDELDRLRERDRIEFALRDAGFDLDRASVVAESATPTIPTGHGVVPVEPEDLSNCTDGFGINKTVNAMLADALRFLAKPGQKVIWRGSFRWFDDDGVLSNHYDGMDIDHLARDFDYEVHYDAHHAALVSKKAAPDAGGV